MKNKSIKKYIIYIIPLIILVLITTANYWVFGILSLFDSETSHKLEPLMEQYLEHKYDGKMKLDYVGRPLLGTGTKIYGEAHRKDKPYISFNIYFNKNKDGSYEFYDYYYKQYLKHQIKNRLNKISQQVYKENFKSGNLTIFTIEENDLKIIELFGIDVSLDECIDIIKYTFDYGVHYNGDFDESKIKLMYDLLKIIYESGIIPNYIWYPFDDASFSYTLTDLDKNGDLISHEDFKKEILSEYNKK